MHLWVLYDKNEMPLAVADSVAEMTEMVGLSRNALYNAKKRGRMVKVVLDEDLAEEYRKERKRSVANRENDSY